MLQKIFASKTASLTDFRDPMKVIEAAGNSNVAIMNRNKLVGYFVPASNTEVNFEYVNEDEFKKLIPEVLKEEKEVLDYLKDK